MNDFERTKRLTNDLHDRIKQELRENPDVTTALASVITALEFCAAAVVASSSITVSEFSDGVMRAIVKIKQTRMA